MTAFESRPITSVERTHPVMVSLQRVQWERLNTVAHNLANASTIGFKAQITPAEEVVYDTRDNDLISYVNTRGTFLDFTNGALKHTGAPLDVALSKEGFFVVNTPNGRFYTRNGEFKIDQDGKLVSAHGDAILNDGFAEIILPKNVNSISISENGDIFADGRSLGKIAVVSFENKRAIAQRGDTLYYTEQDPVLLSNEQTTLHQGYLEEANISPIQESINLIEIVKFYEQSQFVIDESMKLKQKVINVSTRNT
ncbi:MAG: flagellar hook basal-body protein [Alphaproteobacteria bacterium]